MKNKNRFWLAIPLFLQLIALGLFIASVQTHQVANKLLFWDATMSLTAVNCILLFVRLTQARNTDAGIGAVLVAIMMMPTIALLQITGGYVISLGARRGFFIELLSGREIVELPILTLFLVTLSFVAIIFSALYLGRAKKPVVTAVANQPIN